MFVILLPFPVMFCVSFLCFHLKPLLFIIVFIYIYIFFLFLFRMISLLKTILKSISISHFLTLWWFFCGAISLLPSGILRYVGILRVSGIVAGFFVILYSNFLLFLVVVVSVVVVLDVTVTCSYLFVGVSVRVAVVYEYVFAGSFRFRLKIKTT